MKVAIIGGGIAGYHLLNELLKHKNSKQHEIMVFDDTNHLGRGMAFQRDDSELLLNYPSNLISLKKNKPDDFYRWVKSNQSMEEIQEDEGDNRDAEGNIYFSRQLFGDYLEQAMNKLTKKKRVTTVNHRVTAMTPRLGGYELTAGDHSYEVDVVFLVPGQLPAVDHYQLTGTPGFIEWPYPLEALDVDTDKTYAVIGSGLSGLDCIRYLTDQGLNQVIAASRNGQVQAVRGKAMTYQFEHFTSQTFDAIKKRYHGLLPLAALIDVFKKECEAQGVDYKRWLNFDRRDPVKALQHDIRNHDDIGDIHSILYQMQHHGYELWPYLSKTDKETFMANYEAKIKENMNPMPEPSAEELLELISRHRAVIKGGLKAVEYKYRKYRLQYEDGTEDRVHYVINATGPAKHITDTDPGELLRHLLDEQLISENPYGGINVMPHDNRVISPFGVADDFIVLGQLTGGVNYGNNGVYELLLEAKRVVKHFYRRR